MSELKRYLVPVAIGVGVFALLQIFNPLNPGRETAQLDCVFEASPPAGPLPLPYSQDAVGRVEYTAELTGKSVHGDVVSWHGRGIAHFARQSQQLAGAVFLNLDNEVRGLGLYRDHYPHTRQDLRISTLNENGNLDWNEESAFVYFEDAPEKMAHAFDFDCSVANGEAQ